MRKLYQIGSLALTAVLCAGLLAGCSKTDASASSSAPASSSVAQTEEAPAFDYSAGIDENGYFTGVKALEYVTLPEDYKAIPLTAEAVAVTDSDVQAQVDDILSRFGTPLQIKDRAVEDGDKVNIDYVGSVDGVEFEGGTTGGNGTTVTAGSTDYIDDFLTQIIGRKAGETFDVNVTFPEDYGKEELNGKPAVFKTTINYIEGETQLPELNDAFVKENLSASYGWSTVAEMNEKIGADLKASQQKTFVWNYISENCTVTEVPESMIEYQKSSMIAYYESMAAQYGMTLDDFMKSLLQVDSKEALLEQAADTIESTARQALILQAVAEAADIKIDDDAVAAYFKDQMGIEDYSTYVDNFGMPYVRMVVMSDTAMRYLSDNAKQA